MCFDIISMQCLYDSNCYANASYVTQVRLYCKPYDLWEHKVNVQTKWFGLLNPTTLMPCACELYLYSKLNTIVDYYTKL